MQAIFHDLHVCRKKTCFNVLCTCKATSLSKMAKLVWRYNDDARAIIENVYKTARRKRIIEPQHEISNNVVCATSKGSDQSAHMRSLIRAFASGLNIL